ncbi:sugar phosphate isomerase/epimerase family protein [Paenibacillus massiliensis]|uniref:sugar phosphate isomerase/epimerase family protein n=1 Tax=Paenibacillus massiliensis TaxID=225917 RepID=UPI0004049489|nr:sugar phosphate isomerase/epimerase [Paenibacillus massiliensis]
MPRMNVGLQLFTLREELATDFRGTLRKVAELGYEGVEFAGYGDIPALEMKALLDELGLKAISSHVGIHLLKDDLQGQIDYLKTIGAHYMICPYIMPDQRPKGEEWKEFIAFLEDTGAKVREQGLQFGYHNHDFEFLEKTGEALVFDAMFQTTAPESLQVELDVCWVQYAGQDPLAYIRQYAGRLPLLHLKDFDRATDGAINTLELGEGLVDLPAVIRESADAGVEWLIVEQDHCQKPPLESVANSLQWVKEHYLSQF